MHHQFILFLLLVLSFPKLTIAQPPSYTILKDSLKSAQTDSSRIQFIFKIYKTADRPLIDSLLDIVEQGLSIAKSNLTTSWGKSYYKNFTSILGHSYRRDRNFRRAKSIFQAYITTGISQNDSIIMSDGYSDLAYVYADEEQFDSTIFYDLKGLEIREKINSPSLGKSYNNLGYDYKIQGLHNKALYYYIKGAKYKEKFGLKEELGNSYMNIGNMYQKIPHWDSTLMYYNLALDNAKELQDSTFIAEALHSLGMTYAKSGSTNLAKDYLLNAMDIFKLLNRENNPRVVQTYQELARVYITLNEVDKAEVLLLKSEEILLVNNKEVSDKMVQNLSILEQVYLKKGDLAKAHQSAQKNYELLDSLHDKNIDQKSQKLLTQYEDKLKEERIKSLEQQQVISDLKNEKLDQERSALIIAVLIMLLIVGFLYRLNRWRSKVNMELEILNNTKDKLFSIIAHDLKNPLSAFRSITQSLSDDIFDISREDLDYFMKQLNNSAHNLFDLLQNLLYWSISQSGRLELQAQKILLKNTTADVFNLLLSSASIKKIDLHNTISIENVAWADQKMTHTVLRNLVANAIKFTPNGGSITASATLEASFITVSLTDTGKGIAPNRIEDLFSLGSDKNKRNEEEGKGTGLGLILCKELVEQQGGKIWLQNTNSKGSTFSFSLPIHSKKA